MDPVMKLSQKVALITGASSGIGRCVSLRFASDKCKIVIIGRSADKLNEVKELSKNLGADVLAIQADLTNDDEVRSLFSKTLESFGRIDVVFNNAGIGYVNPIVNLKEEEIHKMIDTNITAMIMVTKYAAEQMKKQENGGHILITSSIAGLIPVPQWSVYCSTKWAITGFAESIRYELAKSKVLVTTIHPGPVKTDFFIRGNISPEKLSIQNNMTNPEDVAEAVYKILFTNKKRVIIPKYFTWVSRLYKFFPNAFDLISKKYVKSNLY
ncbi:SDR family oxidoreductase [Candidatus Dojkabacteria bacterium]|uniref:SDR family oxidoreductase n=1 Tax=Candidatus Dojkabacteria bacterium TaxID=2099670 RepID=A0A3M0YZV8_9BACT|nr:MAG: SDR family oxidoreductase [Candidatus Dojkabacteria bacterium]